MENEKFKIDAETAAAEFDRMAEAMDLDLDEQFMDEDEVKSFQKTKRRIVKAIRTGSLSFNDDGEPVYTPVNVADASPITFHERTGASLMATNGVAKGHDASKMYRMLGDMCRVHPSTFSKLKGIDIKICEAIFGLLMD